MSETHTSGDPAVIAMDLAVGFSRMVELVARTHVLDHGRIGLEDSLGKLFDHARVLDHDDAIAAVSAALSALKHTIIYPGVPNLSGE